jgi:hypothetical protein
MEANADTARTFAKGFAGELYIGDAIGVLKAKAGQVQRGDLSEVEATLAAQAVTLDAIFNGLPTRAALNMGQHLGATRLESTSAMPSNARNNGRSQVPESPYLCPSTERRVSAASEQR